MDGARLKGLEELLVTLDALVKELPTDAPLRIPAHAG